VRENEKPNGVSSAGFTLVELLVVLAVVAVLLSILIPSLRKARVTAFRAGCASNLRQINLGLNMYLDDSDGIYPCAEDPVSVEPVYWLWMGRGWRPFVRPYLGGSLDARDPSVLLCPEDRSDPAMYESTSYAYSMAFYHSPDQIDAMSRGGGTGRGRGISSSPTATAPFSRLRRFCPPATTYPTPTSPSAASRAVTSRRSARSQLIRGLSR